MLGFNLYLDSSAVRRKDGLTGACLRFVNGTGVGKLMKLICHLGDSPRKTVSRYSGVTAICKVLMAMMMMNWRRCLSAV